MWNVRLENASGVEHLKAPDIYYTISSSHPIPYPGPFYSPMLHDRGFSYHTSRQKISARRSPYQHVLGVIVCRGNCERLWTWMQPGNIAFLLQVSVCVCLYACVPWNQTWKSPQMTCKLLLWWSAAVILDLPWPSNTHLETIAALKASHSQDLWILWLLILLAGSQAIRFDASWNPALHMRDMPENG